MVWQYNVALAIGVFCFGVIFEQAARRFFAKKRRQLVPIGFDGEPTNCNASNDPLENHTACAWVEVRKGVNRKQKRRRK